MQNPRRESFPYSIASAILLVALVDTLSSRLTMPVLYTIPLLMYALSHRRRWLPALAIAAVALSFAVLWIKVHFFPQPHLQQMLPWRLVNRAFASVAICLSASLLYFWVGLHDRMQTLAAQAEAERHTVDSAVFRQLLRSITVLLAAVAGGVLTAIILVADLMCPAPANLPILYAVPLILVSLWLQSRRVLWGVLPFLLCLTVMGYLWGPAAPANLPHWTLRGILINRVLAAAELTIVAIILHVRMGRQYAIIGRVEEFAAMPA